MICKKCGTENAEDSQFCSKCGNNLKSKKKIINNIYALLSIILFCICFFVKENIYLFILLIVSIILSIIAIIKSSKLKKEIGKRKGITISIITLVLGIIILLANTLMSIDNINLDTNTQKTSYNSLSNTEKIAYQGIKELYNRINDEDNLVIDSIYYIGSETMYINFTGKNSFNATVKNYFYYSPYASKIYTGWSTEIGQKLDKDKIIQVYNSSK